MKFSVKKILILGILILCIVGITDFFLPRKVETLINKDYLIGNVNTIELSHNISMEDSITITDTTEIKKFLTSLSQATVRKSSRINIFNSTERDYFIYLEGDTVESTGGIQILEGKYIFFTTYKQRVSEDSKNVTQYRVKDFDFEYLNSLLTQ